MITARRGSERFRPRRLKLHTAADTARQRGYVCLTIVDALKGESYSIPRSHGVATKEWTGFVGDGYRRQQENGILRVSPAHALNEARNGDRLCTEIAPRLRRKRNFQTHGRELTEMTDSEQGNYMA